MKCNQKSSLSLSHTARGDRVSGRSLSIRSFRQSLNTLFVSSRWVLVPVNEVPPILNTESSPLLGSRVWEDGVAERAADLDQGLLGAGSLPHRDDQRPERLLLLVPPRPRGGREVVEELGAGGLQGV